MVGYMKIVTDPWKIRRELFEQEIDRCKRNVELIFDEYSRILDKDQFLTTTDQVKDSRDTLRQLGKTYINADILLRTKDDWTDDVIDELEDHNKGLREWIHRRENPEFDMDNSITILEARIHAVYPTTQRLVDAVRDAQEALYSHLWKEATESEK